MVENAAAPADLPAQLLSDCQQIVEELNATSPHLCNLMPRSAGGAGSGSGGKRGGAGRPAGAAAIQFYCKTNNKSKTSETQL